MVYTNIDCFSSNSTQWLWDTDIYCQLYTRQTERGGGEGEGERERGGEVQKSGEKEQELGGEEE